MTKKLDEDGVFKRGATVRILIALAVVGLVSAAECDGADAFKVSDAVVVKARFEEGSKPLDAKAKPASLRHGMRNKCVLPGESGTNAPVANAVFPDRMSEYVWRNWFCVDKRTLAATVGAKPEELTEIATQMGLPPDPAVEPEWQKHGYVTVLRRNWHILPYEQLMELVGWDRATFRYHLDEDDYLYAKMGALKPKCDRLTWRGKEEKRFADARRRIAAILKEEGVDAFSAGGEPRFAFMRELAAPPTTCKTDVRAESPFKTRLQFSYFADYADPLMDDSVASFPEGLLARYAKDGVNAVWLHVVLRTLAKDRHFTEFGEGCDRRQENLRKLVARAAKYGIKVFLYMNEPRPMPCAFFDSPKNAPCRGTLEWRGVTNAMCIETPEVRRWMKDAMEQVFRAAPGLGGIFIIGASENLVHCQAHGSKSVYENDKSGWCKPDQFCKRCENLSFAQLVAEDASLLIEGMHRADPSAKAFVWDWGWGTYAKGGDVAVVGEVLPRLPKDNVSFMTMSERMLPLSIDGVNCFVNEYSLSQVGPSEAAKEKWAMARKAGLGCIAKAQVSSSWEMAIVPYVPVMDNIARHAFNLAHNGVDGVMLSWSCGCYPSPNLMIFNGVRADDRSHEDVLVRVSRELYGDRAAPLARRLWTTLSKAFARYPFNSATLYRAPHHMGPANPLYPNKTGYAATMVGMPYDDLDGWRSIFPAETYIARCRQVAEGFDEGARQWQEVVAVCEGESKALAEREHGIIRTVGLHMASCADQSLFVLARDRGDKEEMREIAQRELVRAKALLSIAERDSRIGYECSCHYFYTPQDLREKVLNCRMILSVAADAVGTSTCR